ncbi:hypothetical protein ABFS82_06G064200 [Erythranthe guttata]|uniref:uncharacterized protein LOC105977653 n=1 Tax=Erythranthe guttata TaxID=4155 RepID=UPI00064DE7C4|nr:PREDICTED: uncharacterized protein LOC105977653 [Erythranthe guttata]|eukprot:XP_012858442.1 PREDICTED: uncharacterized protein LOC105977653 [Erythranthe guttata]
MALRLTDKLNDDEPDCDDNDFYCGHKLMYDRDTPGYFPPNLEDCIPLVDLAIDSYNQQHSKDYRVVEIVRIIAAVCSGIDLYMKFTAAASKEDGGSDAAVTFGAEVHKGITETTVEYVYVVAEGATLPVDVLPACYNPCG